MNLDVRGCWVALVSALFLAGCAGRPASPYPELDAARAWLNQNPPSATNTAERRQRMALIQQAADALSSEQWNAYRKAWTDDPALADRMEAEHPVLHYLSGAWRDAIRDIRRTRVRQGVVAWHLYNMGYVFRTPDACFGIDLSFRGAEQLARDLDFLLVTHPHGDHRSDALIQAMEAQMKPVVTSFRDSRWRVRMVKLRNEPMGPSRFTFGPVAVHVDVGDHHDKQPDQRDNMLMYEIDCGPRSLGCVIYHSGDNSNLQKILPEGPVGIFIPHVSVGLPIEKSIRQLDPSYAFISHLLELGHSTRQPEPWRWSFDFAFDKVKNIDPGKAIILTWGERWQWPGTR